MTDSSPADPSSFFLEGGPTGVLVIHGFTGSPAEMRLLGEYLHQRGFTVAGPCLPGHGTTVADLNETTWRDWTGHVATALADLQSERETVFVAGLSLGALLTLYLAAQHPEIAGAVAYSPAIMVNDWRTHLVPIAKHIVRELPKSEDHFADPVAESRLWSYDTYPVVAAHELLKLIGEVKRALPRVSCPLLIIHSTADEAIHPDSAQFVFDRVGSVDKDLIALHESGHVITVDSEWETVAECTRQFIVKHLPDTPDDDLG